MDNSLEADWKFALNNTLPIFRQDLSHYSMFYAPSCLCVTAPQNADAFQATIGPDAGQQSEWGQRLWAAALEALHMTKAFQTAPFSPECLTLYLHDACNLGCTYCYTQPSTRPSTRLDPHVVKRAAELVVSHCQRNQRPFTAVFHGGGEPTLFLDQLKSLLSIVRSVAEAGSVEFYTYIATNGVLSAEKALFIAENFDLVGLSCDGMAEIQNRQRPYFGGGSTSAAVERTARLFHDKGRKFQVRATITAATLTCQPEIADYICQHFAPEAISFEPVYLSGKSDQCLGVEHADVFVQYFWEAQQVAKRYEIPLTTSGSRLGELHGPYCNVFRQVLNLVPDGVATACFKSVNASEVERYGGYLGKYNSDTDSYELDTAQIGAVRQRLSQKPLRCQDCFNQYHCTLMCPDYCPLESASNGDILTDEHFRCRVQEALMDANLRRKADQVWEKRLLRAATENESLVYGTVISQ